MTQCILMAGENIYKTLLTTTSCPPQKWMPSRSPAKIKLNGKMVHIGLFNTPQEAGQAYTERARKEFGEYAHGDVE